MEAVVADQVHFVVTDDGSDQLLDFGDLVVDERYHDLTILVLLLVSQDDVMNGTQLH